MPPDHSCPVCSAGAGSGPDLRMHLMVEHRKSELARYLTDERSEDERREGVLTP